MQRAIAEAVSLLIRGFIHRMIFVHREFALNQGADALHFVLIINDDAQADQIFDFLKRRVMIAFLLDFLQKAFQRLHPRFNVIQMQAAALEQRFQQRMQPGGKRLIFRETPPVFADNIFFVMKLPVIHQWSIRN